MWETQVVTTQSNIWFFGNKDFHRISIAPKPLHSLGGGRFPRRLKQQGVALKGSAGRNLAHHGGSSTTINDQKWEDHEISPKTEKNGTLS